MARNDIPEEILELMISYLSGNCGQAETTELEHWVSADAGHKAAFISFKKTWMMASLNAESNMNIDQEWKELSKSITSEGKTVSLAPRKSSRRSWLGIAAAFLVLTAASIWLYRSFDPSENIVAYSTESEAQNNQLPDGSTVSLNQFSSIRYSLSDKGTQRNVALEGDAFFDVKRDETKPFIIAAGKATIEVLGTSFYVDARKDAKHIEVIVKSGSVSVSSTGNKVILKAGEKARLNKTSGSLIASENTDLNYQSFTQQKLVFENTTLKEVVFAINRQYHSNIKISDPNLENCPLTATYTNKSLESVLAILKATLNLEIEQQDKEIVLTGVGC